MLERAKILGRGVWELTWPYWRSEERWTARLLLAAILGLNLGTVYISVQINRWQASFYNSLVAKDVSVFLSQIGRFSYLAAAYIAMGVYQLYLNQMLQIRWRRWLTATSLEKWLGGHTYYFMELIDRGTDNPDQRIAEDLRAFVEITLSLVLGVVNAAVTLGAFLVVLWSLSGSFSFAAPDGRTYVIHGYLVWAALLYSAVGTYLTHRVGRPLIGLNFDQQRYEADFRFQLVRLRENAESVAFYGGERGEERTLSERFAAVFSNWWAIMKAQKRLTWFTSGYGQASVIFPVLMIAPRYFRGEIQLGGLIQTTAAFGEVQGSLSWFVGAYPAIAQWKAVVDRLIGFREAMARTAERRRAESELIVHRTPEPRLALEDVEVRLPDGAVLLSDISFAVEPGERVLLTGPSGVGKSTLLRLLAGLWPFGRGRILLPETGRFLFLPQKAYLPMGTLREVVSYPSLPDAFGAAEVTEALEVCELGHLAEELDRVRFWSMQLSGGEQQRVAFARVLLHRPEWLFMDEASAALDEATERKLYRTVDERLPGTAIVSVGHRRALSELHRRSLRLDRDAEGRGVLKPLPSCAGGAGLPDEEG
ncbi:MAG: ABC transporter ATP-binding protein/permease [Deltaproteobacteria bacterium]|nr:ABC transporter ATP-binding protein/permease [Deltaproteobacteria bacterium]